MHDEEFLDGFDKYAVVGGPSPITQLLMGEYNSWSQSNGGFFTTMAPLSGDGSGAALQIAIPSNPSGTAISLVKILRGNYARVCGGVTFRWDSVSIAQPFGIVYTDGATAQFAVTINPDGTFSIRRGDDDGTILATTIDAPAVGTINCLEWDIVCHNGAGTATLYLNSVPTSIEGLTLLDTSSNANNYFNQFKFMIDTPGTVGGQCSITIDHFYNRYYIDPAAAGAGCMRTNPVIDTDVTSEDYAIDFTPTITALGDLARVGSSVVSPAANSLLLRKFTPLTDIALSSMNFYPNATSATAKFKGVVYNSNGGGTAPTTLLAAGTEVVGCTSGVLCSSGIAGTLIAGVTYWIGFIADTSLSWQLVDAAASGYRAANTYASGAPDPAPAMTAAQGSFFMFALGVPAEGFAQLRRVPPSGFSTNVGDTVGQKDMFGFDPLTVTPDEIHSVAYKVNLRRSDAGARTVQLVCESNGVEGNGDREPAAPSTSGTWLPSYFANNPETGLPWTAADLNAAHAGYEIVT